MARQALSALCKIFTFSVWNVWIAMMKPHPEPRSSAGTPPYQKLPPNPALGATSKEKTTEGSEE